MERVSEIRADIAENAAHVNNKMLLVELREVSRLFAERCERVDKDEFDLEVFERVGIVRVAARAEDAKRIHSLFDCTRLVQAPEWKDLKDLSQRKTSGGVAYDGSTKQGRGRKTIQRECGSNGRK